MEERPKDRQALDETKAEVEKQPPEERNEERATWLRCAYRVPKLVSGQW